MNEAANLNTTTILSIGVVLMPILFAALLWKIRNSFVTTERFVDYQTLAEVQRGHMAKGIEEMNRKLDVVIEAKLLNSQNKNH